MFDLSLWLSPPPLPSLPLPCLFPVFLSAPPAPRWVCQAVTQYWSVSLTLFCHPVILSPPLQSIHPSVRPASPPSAPPSPDEGRMTSGWL